MVDIVITSGTSFVVPQDFVSLRSIDGIGAGGFGAGGDGGIGGNFSRVFVVAGIGPGVVYQIQVGAAGGTVGSGTSPTANTWFKDGSTLVAAGIDNTTTNSVGSLVTAGGNGGVHDSGSTNGGGGGGAGGPNGPGQDGASGTPSSPGAGGAGDAGFGGAGGLAGSPGSAGAELAGGVGPGGGGGAGVSPTGTGRPGGNFGAGGGGRTGSGGAGFAAPGAIIFSYNSSKTPHYVDASFQNGA